MQRFLFVAGLWLLGIGIGVMPGWPDAAGQTGYFIAGIACGLALGTKPMSRRVENVEKESWE